jgi:phage protein D/phage baseplate assembly protein gpV
MSPTAEEHVASYDLLVDGDDLAQEQKDRIKEIRILNYLRLPDVCTIALAYPQADGVDSMPFEIGKSFEVRLGATEDLAPTALFKGEVTSIEAGFGEGGCAVTVNAFDRAHRLNRTRARRTFQNQTSSDIVEKIAGDAGLTAQCDPSGEPHEFIQQDNETDWDFMCSLAERIGFQVMVHDSTLTFAPPKPATPVELEWPVTLRSFTPRVTAVQQVDEVTLRAHDPKTKQTIDVSATSPNQLAQIGVDRATVAGAFEDATLHVATEPVVNRAEGVALTQALLDKLANGYISAEAQAPGNPAIRAGMPVKVSGVGQKFSGVYYVAFVKHVLRSGGFETFFANSPSHTVLGAVSGGANGRTQFGVQLVEGIVTNNDDPDGMGRVRVRYPALGDDVEGGWARIATPSAGENRGLLMLPVVGEEVLVGFEHGDTRFPFVLGSLFNGVEKPGDDLLQGKDGSFALKSDHKVFVQSGDDITIRSGKQLVVDVSDQASMKAQRPFSIEGQSVSVKGNSDVTIEGTSTLTLKCGAAQIQLSSTGVTISGPTVNIG